MKLKYTSRNTGLTLIEALIWFAIFAAVVAGVFSLYASSRNASNASTVNKELATIFSQTEQLFASDDTAGLNNTIGLQLGIFPKSLKVDTKTGAISNVFGGTVTLSGQAPSGFTVVYTNIPSGEVCSNIVRAQKAVGWDTGGSVAYDKDYSIAKVGTACGNNGSPAKPLTFIRATPKI